MDVSAQLALEASPLGTCPGSTAQSVVARTEARVRQSSLHNPTHLPTDHRATGTLWAFVFMDSGADGTANLRDLSRERYTQHGLSHRRCPRNICFPSLAEITSSLMPWRRPWSPLDCKIKSVSPKGNQSVLKEISPEYSLEGLMLKLKL